MHPLSPAPRVKASNEEPSFNSLSRVESHLRQIATTCPSEVPPELLAYLAFTASPVGARTGSI